MQDATNKTTGEIHAMPEADRYATAMTRVRFWKWWAESLFGDENKRQSPR